MHTQMWVSAFCWFLLLRFPRKWVYMHFTSTNANALPLSLSFSLTTHFVLIRYFSDPNHNGAPRGRLVSHTLVIPHFITNFFPTLISKFQCSIFCCLVVVVILQEIGEEGLLDGNSKEEKVVEPACRWRGGLRRQLLCRFAPWYHTEAPAFPWRHDSHQGIRFKGFLCFFIFEFGSWSLALRFFFWVNCCCVVFFLWTWFCGFDLIYYSLGFKTFGYCFSVSMSFLREVWGKVVIWRANLLTVLMFMFRFG